MAFTIEKKDWNKIINYARARHAETKDEIGGMALVKPVPDTDDYRISHPVILKQVTSGGNCILDKDELANYYVDMALKHGNDIQFLWWHSHGNMEAFWSGTDTNTMTEYASGNWSVFLVVNIREEYKFRITCWEPQEMYIDTELEILGNNQRKIPTNITNEVSEKCTAYTYTYKNPIAVNKIKTHLHRRLKEAEPGMGYLHFYPTITNDYFEELTAEREVRKVKNGYQAERVWMKKSGVRNEALDEWVYGYACLHRCYQRYDRRTIWDQFAKRLVNPANESKTPTKVRRQSVNSGYVNSW